MAKLPTTTKKQESRSASKTRKLPNVISRIFDNGYNADARQQEIQRTRLNLDKSYSESFQRLDSELIKTTNSLNTLSKNFYNQLDVLERIKYNNSDSSHITHVTDSIFPSSKPKQKMGAISETEPKPTSKSSITENLKEKSVSAGAKIAKGGMAAAKMAAVGLAPVSVIISGYSVINELDDIEKQLAEGKIDNVEYKKKYAEALGSFFGGVAGSEVLGAIGAAIGLPLGGIGSIAFGTIGGVSGFFAGEAIGKYVGQFIASRMTNDAASIDPPEPLSLNEETQKIIRENLKLNSIRDRFDPSTLILLDRIASANIRQGGSSQQKLEQLIPEAFEKLKKKISYTGEDEYSADSRLSKLIFDASKITIEANNFRFPNQQTIKGNSYARQKATNITLATYSPDIIDDSQDNTQSIMPSQSITSISTQTSSNQSFLSNQSQSTSDDNTNLDLTNATQVDAATDKILQTIRTKESSNNYKEQSKSSSASGAYQFIDSTWKNLTKKYNIGTEYDRAVMAPPNIQDAVASRYVADILKEAGGDVTKVPLAWYTGNIRGDISAANVAANSGQTAKAYQDKWLSIYQNITGKTIAQQAPANNSTGTTLNSASTGAEAAKTTPQTLNIPVPPRNNQQDQTQILNNRAIINTKNDIDLRTRAIQTLAA